MHFSRNILVCISIQIFLLPSLLSGREDIEVREQTIKGKTIWNIF